LSDIALADHLETAERSETAELQILRELGDLCGESF